RLEGCGCPRLALATTPHRVFGCDERCRGLHPPARWRPPTGGRVGARCSVFLRIATARVSAPHRGAQQRRARIARRSIRGTIWRMPAPADRLRILLSEGSSTSAREAITALGLAGHDIEISDPDPFCLGRFSRFVKRFHRCPPLGSDPEGYLAHVLDRVAGGRFDVLLPIH